MTDIWDILGLEGATDDVKAIKKAYAKQLRTTRPDDNPEGFMALRSALEEATYHAQYLTDLKQEKLRTECTAEITQTHDHSDTCEKSESKPVTPAISAETTAINESASTGEFVLSVKPPLLDEIERLIKDPFGRSDVKQWTRIFDDPHLESIDASIDFEENLRVYLLDILGYFDGDPDRHNMNRNPKLFSTRVGNHIFKTMGWRDVQGRPFYVQDQLEWLRKDLDVLNRSKPSTRFQKEPKMEVIHANEDKSLSAWQIAIGLVVIVNVIRLLFEYVN